MYEIADTEIRDRRQRTICRLSLPPWYDLPSLPEEAPPRTSGITAAYVRDHRRRPARGDAASNLLEEPPPPPVSDGRRRRRRRRPLRGDAAATCAEPQGRVRRSSQGVLAGRTQVF
ncbi:hypothetical protein VPH35_119797 [Triticum aestivum]|uniref:Uncharacterized protein n=1 Tax=Triticum urartu TaxID=4572 RepID=A0A8R7QYG0_TRIUA